MDSQIKAEIHGVDFSYSDIKRTRKLLLREKIDVIDVNGINSGLFAVLMNLPIRRVTTVHSNADVDRADKPRLVRKAFVALENYCLHKSKKVIVVSKAIEKLLLERGIESNKIYLIPNGVKEIHYAEKSLRSDEIEPLRICYVGRLEKVKGCEYLISALKRLKNVDYIRFNSCVNGTAKYPCKHKKTSCRRNSLPNPSFETGGGKADLDIFTIGVTCSGGMSYKATEQYKKLQNMPISKMFYRGDGWPGKNCLISSDGNKIEYVHNGSLFERMFSSQIFKNPGCRGCKDHFAEQAEISFCDFWNAEERKTESEGNSCVIIRSARADEYFNKMQKLGFIEVVRDLDEKEVADTQMHALKAKKGKLHSSIRYHVFTKAIDYVFAHNL